MHPFSTTLKPYGLLMFSEEGCIGNEWVKELEISWEKQHRKKSIWYDSIWSKQQYLFP